MALLSEINNAASTMATLHTNARNSIPEAWYPLDKVNLVTEHIKKAEANALFQVSDLAWQNAMAYNQYNADRPTLGQDWFNKGAGWVEASARRVPIIGEVELRGVVYSTTASMNPVLTLPNNLKSARNEQFTVNYFSPAGLGSATVYVFTSGVVAVWGYGYVNAAPPTAIDYLTLSGIRFEAMY